MKNILSLALLSLALAGCKSIEVDRKEKSWTIDANKCVRCGFCVDHCPKKCLQMK